MTYSIASKTTTGSKKEESEPNGDWLRWLETEKCVLLTVAVFSLFPATILGLFP